MSDNGRTENEKPTEVDASGLPDLLPCPFCGGDPVMGEWDWPYVRYRVKCKCGATATAGRRNTYVAAAKLWNTRAR